MLHLHILTILLKSITYYFIIILAGILQTTG